MKTCERCQWFLLGRDDGHCRLNPPVRYIAQASGESFCEYVTVARNNRACSHWAELTTTALPSEPEPENAQDRIMKQFGYQMYLALVGIQQNLRDAEIHKWGNRPARADARNIVSKVKAALDESVGKK